jgi:hypothetical protein
MRLADEAIIFAFSVSGGVGVAFSRPEPIACDEYFNVDPGTYTVTEERTPSASYLTAYDDCAHVGVGAGQSAVRTRTRSLRVRPILAGRPCSC